jgi:hypothetical protein
MTFPHDPPSVTLEEPTDPRVTALHEIPSAVLVAALVRRGEWTRVGCNTLIRRTK